MKWSEKYQLCPLSSYPKKRGQACNSRVFPGPMPAHGTATGANTSSNFYAVHRRLLWLTAAGTGACNRNWHCSEPHLVLSAASSWRQERVNGALRVTPLFMYYYKTNYRVAHLQLSATLPLCHSWTSLGRYCRLLDVFACSPCLFHCLSAFLSAFLT